MLHLSALMGRLLQLGLVPRTRSSHDLSASPFANFGFKRGTRIIELLVSLRFRSSHQRSPQGCANFGIGTLAAVVHFGCGTMRRYGRGAFQPAGNCFLASSSDTEPEITTSSPCFQFTGVATLCLAVSCSESITRSTSSKLRPVVIG